MKWAPWIIGLAGLAVVSYGVLLNWRHPPRVVATATIEVENPRNGRRVKLRTRTLETAGGVRMTEVELPGGTWVGCTGGDCARTVRDEHFELFDALREKGH